MPAVLIVDDEPNIRRMLGALLVAEGYDVRDAADGAMAVQSARENAPDAVLLDLMMPGALDGLATLARVREHDPDLPIIMMSGRAGLSDAVRATKLGAFNFLEKPLSPEAVLLALAAALELRRARHAARALRAELGLSGQLVGDSAGMRQVEELIARVAPSDSRVLITGESGTGKELVAAAVHDASPRRDRPFIRVNCAAIPRDLVESEMFGHERGAFTGAGERRIGRFELAHTGTLLLDEVGDLGPEAQAKLLRAIETKEFERLGGSRPIRVDVRILAATNKDLVRAVREGSFREDLYFRLAVIPIVLPPLRQRPEDIPALVEHFARQHRTRTGRAVAAWTPEALRLLTCYPWPGNVRELANIVERIAILHAGSTVSEYDVREVLPLADEPVLRDEDTDAGAPEIAERELSPVMASPAPAAATANGLVDPEDTPLADALDAFERTLIVRALSAAGGSVSEAARRLQTDRPNLYRRMRRLGIDLGATVVALVALALASALSGAGLRAQQSDSAGAPAPRSVPQELRSAPDTTPSGTAGPSDVDSAALPARDTTPPSEGSGWWRRLLDRSSRPANYIEMSVSSGRTYNRVQGLPVYAGPIARRTLPWGTFSTELYGVVNVADKLRWDEDHVGYSIHPELQMPIGGDRQIGIGGRFYDIIGPVESWQLSDGEVALSTFLLHRDYRDYYGRHGATGYLSFQPNGITSLTVSYGDERWASRPVRDPFTLFRNGTGWRPNPAVDDGLYRLVDAHAVVDTRNDDADPWAGWYVSMDIEQGAGHVVSFGPRADLVAPVVPDAPVPVDYVRGFLDARRYNRLGPSEQLNFRLVLGGWLGGDELPLQRRLSLGGAGTLPGFDFRTSGPGPDLAACSTTPVPPAGDPAQCERIILGQIEFRHDLRVGLADLIRGVPLDGAWVLFADMGRGWLIGPPDGILHYRPSTLPPLSTYRTDAGIGVTLGPFGFYVAQPVTPWGTDGPRFVIRLTQRF